MSDRPVFEQFTAVRSIHQAKWSPDGTRFAYLADTSGRMQLWMQAASGGPAIQLSALPARRVTGFSWSPDGSRIAFLADHLGDEMHQVFVTDVLENGGSWPRQLTDSPASQFMLGGWTPDSFIVISGNDREPSEVDIALLDPATGELERIVTGGRNYAGDASPDGRWLTATRLYSNSNSDVVLIDLATGGHEIITAHEGDVSNSPGPWDADSGGFLMFTDQDREFTAVVHYSVAGGSRSPLLEADMDVELASQSRDGRWRAFVLNDQGRGSLRLVDLERDETVTPELPGGVIEQVSLHPGLPRALVTMGSGREPTNIFELDFLSLDLERREQALLGGLDPDLLAEPEAVSYPSFDRDIPAWLYRPEGAGPFPVLLSIHGGPEAQERPEYAYMGMYQYLVGQGIAVLAPNIRGSTGYGKSYQRLIQRDWGGGELGDIDAAAKWLGQQDWVRSDRIGIFGASFGGFATLSAISRLPDHWAVAAEAVGPVNLVTFAESVPPHWKPAMKHFVGDPEEDRELLVERSPLKYLDAVKTPLLVYQGANDPRVVQAESDQLVAALREHGIDVTYHVDEEGGHGPANRDAAITWWRVISEFLVGHLNA